MESKVFEKLNIAGFIKRGKVQSEAIMRAPFVRTIDLLDEITAVTIKSEKDIIPSVYSHCASFGLGGGRDECWGLGCRLEAVDELTRFAALYSDNVIVHNFLADFAPSWGHPPEEDAVEFRQFLIDDLDILLRLQPLIEGKRISVFTPPANICPYCYAKKLFGSKADQRLNRAMKSLTHDLYKNSIIEFGVGEDEYEATIKTEGNLFRHQSHSRDFETMPDAILNEPELAERINAGEKVILEGKVKQEIGIHKDLANEVLTSIRYQMSVADVVGASFLTHRKVDVDLLTFVSDDEEMNKRNSIAAKYFNTIVPFAGDVPIKNLIRLREREEDSFIQFRSALDIAMQEITSGKGIITDKDAQSLYADVIAPELARLEKKVREAKRDLVKPPILSAAGTIAVLFFGLYSGMIPAELKDVAASLGLTKVIYDTVSKTVDKLDTEKSIRPEKFYFLWKVKHHSKKKRTKH